MTNDQLGENDSINLINKLIADRLYFYNLYEMSYRMTDSALLLLIESLRGNFKELEKLHFPISLSQILDVKLKREIELAGGKWNRPEIQFETLESIRYKPRSIPE